MCTKTRALLLNCTCIYLVRVLGDEDTELLPQLVLRLTLLGHKLILKWRGEEGGGEGYMHESIPTN